MTRLATLAAATLLIAAACTEPRTAPGQAHDRSSEVVVAPRDVPLYPGLASFISETLSEFDQIPEQRRKQLVQLAGLVTDRSSAGDTTRLTFICTHNSRRSHMSQIWAQTAAHYFGVPRVETFSGGTEATAFNPRAVAALERAGFRIDTTDETSDPVYRVRYTDDMDPMECFSKVYHQPPNPTQDFLAVMTCSQADRNCPLVLGAAERIAIPYDDPKAFDGTEQETAKYDERCRQIGREMLYLFSRVKY
jgi:protein-tyrosine-phosphatase